MHCVGRFNTHQYDVQIFLHFTLIVSLWPCSSCNDALCHFVTAPDPCGGRWIKAMSPSSMTMPTMSTWDIISPSPQSVPPQTLPPHGQPLQGMMPTQGLFYSYIHLLQKSTICLWLLHKLRVGVVWCGTVITFLLFGWLVKVKVLCVRLQKT